MICGRCGWGSGFDGESLQAWHELAQDGHVSESRCESGLRHFLAPHADTFSTAIETGNILYSIMHDRFS